MPADKTSAGLAGILYGELIDICYKLLHTLRNENAKTIDFLGFFRAYCGLELFHG
jgi:hypothetical protein